MIHRFVVLLFFFFAITIAADAQQFAWEESHGIHGHRLTSVLARGTTIWIGTESGGLFWSAGAPFAPSRQGLPVGRVTSIEMDGRGTIYAGVEDGTWRSTDAGRSWQHLAEIDGAMTALAWSGSSVFVAAGGGLYRATGDGATFGRIIDPALGDDPITALESSGSLVLAGTTIAVLRSTDLGSSWTRVPLADPAEFPFPVGVGALGVSPAGVTAYLSRFFLSEDGGLTYTSLADLTEPRVRAMLSDGDRVIAATGAGVSASTDGGKTFATLLSTGGQPVLDVARDGNTLAAITARDIYISSDRGINWTMKTPVIEAQPVTVLASMGDEVVYAIADSALYRSTNAGRDFTRASADTTRLGLRDVRIGGDGLFALAGPYTILRSRDAGASWTDVSGIRADSGFPVAMIHVHGSTVIAATHFYGIYHSTDNGDTWNVTKDDSPERILDNPRAFAVWGNEIYLATRDNLLRSTDEGATWISEGRFGGLDRSIVALGGDGNHLYAATSTDVYVKSMDKDQWEIVGDLPGVKSLVVTPWIVFAGTGRNGVWMTYHGGSLRRIDDMTGSAADINDLAISGDRLVAATESNVWSTHADLGDGVREDADLSRSLHARYDAADGMLHLSLSIPRPADLDIDLVDLRGTVVRELLEERMEGVVEKRFTIDSLPAGLYFISVRSAAGVASVPVTIIGRDR